MAEAKGQVPGFNSDPTDRRSPGQWQSIYPKEARRVQYAEAAFLTLLLLAGIATGLTVWMEAPRGWYRWDALTFARFESVAMPFLGGLLGGACFSVKWLCHAVARQHWHADRTLWRLLSPFISGLLALVMLQLIPLGLFAVLRAATVSTSGALLSLGWLCGYYADSAFGKLAQIAGRLFSDRRHRRAPAARRQAAAPPRQDA